MAADLSDRILDHAHPFDDPFADQITNSLRICSFLLSFINTERTMANKDVDREERPRHHDNLSLKRERRRIRKMKVIFGMFSAALLLSLILSLILNR
jgi:hypothetical protein